MFKPRPMQEEILRYTTGKMGVAAVPGSGKTHTLSLLAARLITSGVLAEDQEILVVTLVNSAVDNFTSRISAFLKERNLIPNLGYRVRTLHGLAHDIVRERPSLVGLADDFQIVEEREAAAILRGIVVAWIHLHPDFLREFTEPGVDITSNPRVRKQWEELLIDTSSDFIRSAKDRQLSPSDLLHSLEETPGEYPLLAMGVEIYGDYQKALNFRSAVDFDDLIQYGLRAIQVDADYLHRLQHRWPFILEDEAQDSSRLQEEMLRLLSGEGGNWVRVGDSNQAIYETFTTANPSFLREFLTEKDVQARNLANSGRSTDSIIAIANHLIAWTMDQHPCIGLRDSLSKPFIEPSPAGDPQPNPPDDPDGIFFGRKAYQPTEEAKAVVGNIKKWLPSHSENTVAVLVPRNERGVEIVDLLKKDDLPYLELLRSTRSTRQIAEVLANILDSLADPSSPNKLALAFRTMEELHEPGEEEQDEITRLFHHLRDHHALEDLFSPASGFLEKSNVDQLSTKLESHLAQFILLFTQWHMATLLPIDQLILTISQQLLSDPVEIALAYKLASMLAQSYLDHPDWHLPDFSEQLNQISHNQRKFIGFSGEDTGFDPDEHKGQVVVSTIHKAKGLEWDRVYLVSVNNYDFPSLQPSDSFIGEKWFLIQNINLSSEILGQLKALADKDPVALHCPLGQASMEARSRYASERLRLLFVGLTRARREVIITWNTGRQKNCGPALALQELSHYWKEGLDAAK
jgi:DNA helicase-2/ATP-dependent DNA helicase PcrA